jgi:hypothetical protein
MSHEVRHEPIIALTEPGINLISANEIARKRGGWENIRVDKGGGIRERWREKASIVPSTQYDRTCRMSPRSRALLEDRLMMFNGQSRGFNRGCRSNV